MEVSVEREDVEHIDKMVSKVTKMWISANKKRHKVL